MVSIFWPLIATTETPFGVDRGIVPPRAMDPRKVREVFHTVTEEH